MAVLSPDMKRVRAKQQQHAQQRATEAKELARKHRIAAMERKRVKSPEEERWDRMGGEGKKLGSDDDDGGGGVRNADAAPELRQRRRW